MTCRARLQNPVKAAERSLIHHDAKILYRKYVCVEINEKERERRGFWALCHAVWYNTHVIRIKLRARAPPSSPRDVLQTFAIKVYRHYHAQEIKKLCMYKKKKAEEERSQKSFFFFACFKSLWYTFFLHVLILCILPLCIKWDFFCPYFLLGLCELCARGKKIYTSSRYMRSTFESVGILKLRFFFLG